MGKFLDRGEIDPYNYARTQVWMSSLRIIAEKPLLGSGFGEYYNVSKRFAFPVEGLVARYLKRAQIAHSEYLQYAAETGVPATVLLLSLLGYLIYLAWKRAENSGAEYRCFHEAAIFTAVGIGTHALADNWQLLCLTAGVLDERGRPPRLHDMRHSFAVAALDHWYRQSVDVSSKLPHLATYGSGEGAVDG